MKKKKHKMLLVKIQSDIQTKTQIYSNSNLRLRTMK